jgi:hypothetical protein
MPCLRQFRLVLAYQFLDLPNFLFREPNVTLKMDWIQPELRCLVVTPNMNVDGFAAIARIEEEAIRPAPQYRWAHYEGSASFSRHRPDLDISG